MLNLGFFSGRKAPNIRVAPGLVDRIMELIAGLLMISSWVLSFMVHTNNGYEGEPGWYFYPAIATLTFLVVGGSAYFPIRFINFPVRVHEGNVVVQYIYATRFARAMNIIIQLISLCTVLFTSSAYFGLPSEKQGVVFLTLAGLLLVALAVYQILARRYK